MSFESILQTIEESCCIDLEGADLSSLLEHQSILENCGDYWDTTRLEDAL